MSTPLASIEKTPFHLISTWRTSYFSVQRPSSTTVMYTENSFVEPFSESNGHPVRKSHRVTETDFSVGGVKEKITVRKEIEVEWSLPPWRTAKM